MKQIRLWKVGHIDQTNLANSHIPTSEALRKVRSLIKEALRIPSGSVDLIWGPDVTFETIDITGRNFIIDDDGKLEEI